MSYGADDFARDFGLSDEQRAQAEAYAALLLEVQAHTNLIGPSTVPELWRRHFADSAQLLALGGTGRWLDIGSGAGFPGMVLAILGAEVVLVEARQKKAAFLARAVEELKLGGRAQVRCERIEALPMFHVEHLTARALAPVEQLFDWGHRFAAQGALWILPKGRGVKQELDAAKRRFRFEHRLVPSRTADDARILIASRVERRRPC